MKRRRWPYVLAAVLVLLLLADAGAWFVAQRALGRGLARWAASMAAQGMVVTVGSAVEGGFPVQANRSFAISLRAGEAELRSERVVAVLSPSLLGTLRILLPTPVALSAPMLPPIALSSPDWRADVRLDGSGAISTDAHALAVSVAAPDGPPRQAEAALVHLQAQPVADTLDVAGSAQSIVLPAALPGEAWPLGRHLASLAFELAASGRLPPPSPSAPWLGSANLAAWRDSGGAIAVRRLAMGYGPLGVSGQGRLGLDAQLQPQGTASLRVLGYAETLDALVAAHAMTAHAAQAIGAVLGLLARAPEGGGAPEVALNLSLRDRVLTAAGFPLLRLPAWTWPGGA